MPAGRPKALDLEKATPLIVGMFWRRGYAGSTLDEIATALSVTKPTLCRTLGDKEAIFAAAVDAYHREHIEPAEDHLDRAATLGQALEAVFSLFVDRTLDDGLPEGCFLGDNGSSGEFTTGPIATTLNALQSRLARSVQRRIEQAISDGELEPGTTPAPIVQYLLGQFAALSAISRSHPTRTQLDAVVRYMLDGLPWANSPRPDHTQIGTTMTEPATNDIEEVEEVEEEDATLFKSASNNSYYAVYFNALPEPGVDELECEKLTVDLRPERDMTLYVEIYNPNANTPPDRDARRNGRDRRFRRLCPECGGRSPGPQGDHLGSAQHGSVRDQLRLRSALNGGSRGSPCAHRPPRGRSSRLLRDVIRCAIEHGPGGALPQRHRGVCDRTPDGRTARCAATPPGVLPEVRQ